MIQTPAQTFQWRVPHGLARVQASGDCYRLISAGSCGGNLIDTSMTALRLEGRHLTERVTRTQLEFEEARTAMGVPAPKLTKTMNQRFNFPPWLQPMSSYSAHTHTHK